MNRAIGHKAIGLAIGMAVCSAGAAWAQATDDALLSDTYRECMNAPSGGTTMGMNACMGDELARQDKQLNVAYQALMQALPAARRAALRDAQRAWLKFRELQCGFFRDDDAGTMQTLQINQCMLALTARRAADLATLEQP